MILTNIADMAFPCISGFYGLDSAANFLRELTLQPDDWYYRNKEVNYTLNSQGYRAPEWQDIDWSNSIVFMGGSQIFGVGNDDSDTIPNMVTILTGTPTVNLSLVGVGMQFHRQNTKMLIDNNIKPKKVFLIATPKYRFTWMKEKAPGELSFENFGSWLLSNDKQDPTYSSREPKTTYAKLRKAMFTYWADWDHNIDWEYKHVVDHIKLMWEKAGVPVELFAENSEDCELLGVKDYDLEGYMKVKGARARDNSHGDRNFNRRVAETFKEFV